MPLANGRPMSDIYIEEEHFDSVKLDACNDLTGRSVILANKHEVKDKPIRDIKDELKVNSRNYQCDTPGIENDYIVKDEVKEEPFVLEDMKEESVDEVEPDDQSSQRYTPAIEYECDIVKDERLSLEFDESRTKVERELNLADESVTGIQIDNADNTSPKRISNRTDNRKEFVCNFCEIKFTGKCALDRHARLHKGEKQYSCDLCDKTFNHKFQLKVHYYAHTGTTMPYVCEFCQKGFFYKSVLFHHSMAGKFHGVCDTCQKPFGNKCELRQHKLVHSTVTQKKGFSCEICKKLFKFPSQLKAHSFVHEKNKPYVCDVCEKRFIHLAKLVEHSKNHTGVASFVCGICHEKFLHAKSLKVHTLSKHTR